MIDEAVACVFSWKSYKNVGIKFLVDQSFDKLRKNSEPAGFIQFHRDKI